MKKNLTAVLATFVGLSSLAISAPVWADHHEEPSHFFEHHDLNHDKRVTFSEMKKAHDKKLRERFKKLDANNNGAITQDEMDAFHKSMKGKWKHKKQKRQSKA